MELFSLDDDTYILSIISLIESQSLRVADIGGGTGIVADKLAKQGHLVTIIDPCSQMTQLAKKRNQEIRIINEGMPYILDESFDVILIRDCLHHIKKQEETLEACLQMLAEGGIIVVSDFSPRCWKTRIIFLFERLCLEKIKPVEEEKPLLYLKKAGLISELVRVNNRDYIVWGRRS